MNNEISQLLLLAIFSVLAIVVADWAMRRGQYKSRDLEHPRGGIYWRNNGFNWPGLVALVVAGVAVLMWTDTSVYVGPLSSRTNGADLSWILGILVAAALYIPLAWRNIREEAEAARVARGTAAMSNVASDVVPGIASAATTAEAGPSLSET